MKKQFFRYLPGLIPVLALFTSVNAQEANSSLELNLKEYIFNEAKASMALTNEGNTATIHARALKDFSKSFKSAGKPNWIAIKDGFVAKFEDNGVATTVFYDLKGRWSSTIRTYSQDKLPQDVRKMVRSTYYDFNIYLVNEVTVGNKTAYLVKIEDEKTLKTIRVIDGEMDVYEDFIKG